MTYVLFVGKFEHAVELCQAQLNNINLFLTQPKQLIWEDMDWGLKINFED